jgi:hypothetical protein
MPARWRARPSQVIDFSAALASAAIASAHAGLIRDSDLAIAEQIDNATPFAGDTFKFNITITNSCPVDAL